MGRHGGNMIYCAKCGKPINLPSSIYMKGVIEKDGKIKQSQFYHPECK